MPSHKHKKKKKSHKKCKKQDATSSDDEEGFWKVSVSDSDSDGSKTGEILTSLVRKSYINHLQQVLIENFKRGMDSSELCNDSVQELASKWSTVLEQKALRASMLSELYRRNMVSSIKAIQLRTSGKRIYVDEQTLSKLKLSLSKETQTEDADLGKRHDAEVQTDCLQPKRVCVGETQTDLPLLSLLELPLPKTLALSPSSRPYNPAINFSDSCPSSPNVSSSQPLVTTTSDVCNITSTSDLVPPVSAEVNDVTLPSQCKLTVDRNTSQVDLQNVETLRKATSTICDANVKMNNYKHKIMNSPNVNTSKDVSSNANVKNDLNARLTAMGLLNDNESEIDNVKSKKSNWYAEEIAQSCNLTRTLLRMTARRREKVLVIIKELFGHEDEPLTELSEENIRICRKRIAAIVVMELTPMYQAKRIASRFLFKLVAKKITKSLMERSYAPDSRSIRHKVKEFFSNGHIIMSEADCF